MKSSDSAAELSNGFSKLVHIAKNSDVRVNRPNITLQ